MREIKFKFWNKNTKQFEEAYNISSFGINQDFLELTEFYDILQYTGLKDKNGKEIYEGDILSRSVPCSIGEMEVKSSVEFNSLTAMFTIKLEDTEYCDIVLSDYEFTVIGNIYENPELIQ